MHRPIAQFQGVSFPLAEAETQLTMMRQLCYYTLSLRDRGLPHTAEAAMCKWYVPKVACEIIQQCLLTHGHYGYTTDLPFHQRYLDVMGLQIGDGTAQIQKLVIAREKVGRVAVAVRQAALSDALTSWPGIAVRRTASLPLAYVPAIHVFLVSLRQRRGCPGQARA